MAKRDEQVRSDLLRRGVLFDGYHSDMESVHNENAECLLSILNEHGWPSKDLVGEEASHAAWLIVQHAIGKPAFQRQCLRYLQAEVTKGSIEPYMAAYLQDRINVFEGKPQVYGTQFDWDASGKLSPKPIQDHENVDALRRSVGLPTLQEAIEKIRSQADQEKDQAPSNFQEREEKFLQWAQRVGWRT